MANYRLYFTFVFLFCLTGCKKTDAPIVEVFADNVTILYIEGNNDLKSEIRRTINDLELGYTKLLNTNSSILAYIKDNNDYGVLLNIAPDSDSYNIASDTIQVFDVSEPTDASQMNMVLSYIRNLNPDAEYNLILWSHGTAWAPPIISDSPQTFSFGEDRGQQIDIIDLKNALPMHFNFIVFDACSMASIEVLYEFRDKANYIIASPTDVLSEGFPYHNIVSYFPSREKEDIIRIASSYFEHYNHRTGLFKSATISVVDLSKLEKLGLYLAKLNDKKESEFVLKDVQRLDFTDDFPVPLYDFGSFVTLNYRDQEVYDIMELVKEIIIFKNNTPEFLGNRLSSFSGLAISAPQLSSPYYNYYRNLEWSKAIGIN